jgi:TELO2-interacting protein 1
MLDNQVQRAPLALDDKIASYIFFPLAYIFRQIDAFPVLLVEKCVKCLNTLIVHGWQAKISSELVQQILTLLTFIIDGVPGSGKKREIPEETVLEAFRTLTVLFQVSGKSAAAAARLAEPEAMPSVGHTVSVVMDGIGKGVTPDIQQEALRTTQAIYSSIKDQEALASFLPGTISALTKVLSTPGRYKKNVIVACINTVSSVLVRVLGDVPMRATLAKGEQGEVDSSEKNKLLSVSWLKATTDQVKLALSNMMRLRLNDAMEIKDALRKLSVRLLDECHKTLSGCAGMLVETAMILDTGSERQTLMETTLRDLISIYPELSEQAKLAVYNRMASLPRVMNSVDEDAKHVALHDLSKGVTLLRELEIQSSTLEETLLDTLTDSAMALVTNSKPRPEVQGTAVELLSTDNSLASATPQDDYQPVLLNHESQRGTRKAFMKLLQAIGSQPHCSKIATTLLESAQTSDSVNQVIAFWLSFQLVKAAQESSDAETEFLDMTAFNDGSDDMDAVSNDLYSYAVQVVTSHTETAAVDWRLDAVALEVIAHSANRSKEDFRPELIDVLFPVVAYLGSPDQNLRQHAIVTLNGLGRACRYGSVSELMVANVDYMVNSVALRLNSLDISPASTQALAMMLRLAGPRLVPYLDDVVESIFGALENYHGYPVFVESLFSVLKELVDQAVRSDTLLLEDQKRPKEVHKKKPEPIGGLEDLQAFLDRREDRKKRNAEEAKDAKNIIGHPTVPWKDEKEEEDVDEEMPEPEKEKPPNSVTYQLLLRVTNLTQHYLTSPTPMLRRSLLELLATASPALAADEDAFLPLVNAIWPVVISRLYDDETFVSVEACHTLAGLCAAAGDFLATRFKTEWGDGLYTWCRKVKQRVLSMSSQSRPDTQVLSRSLVGNDNILVPTASGEIVKSKSRAGQTESGSLGQHASPVRQWEAVVKLLTAMVSFVRLSDEMFDQITDLLVEVLERSQEVREALEDVNADAVWLARYERGFVEWLPAPEMDDVNFVQMAQP